MRTSLASPEPPPRGTVSSTVALEPTLVDVRLDGLMPVNRRPDTSTTIGWIRVDWTR